MASSDSAPSDEPARPPALKNLVRIYPFGEINAAIAAQHQGDCVKVVLTLEG
jgi:hypothetical protein